MMDTGIISHPNGFLSRSTLLRRGIDLAWELRIEHKRPFRALARLQLTVPLRTLEAVRAVDGHTREEDPITDIPSHWYPDHDSVKWLQRHANDHRSLYQSNTAHGESHRLQKNQRQRVAAN